MLHGASRLVRVLIWPLALLLAGAAAACPLIACSMEASAPSSADNCCSQPMHSSSHCPRPTPAACPYLLVERSLLSKSAFTGPVVAAGTVVVEEPALSSLEPSRITAFTILADRSDTYLQIGVLRI